MSEESGSERRRRLLITPPKAKKGWAIKDVVTPVRWCDMTTKYEEKKINLTIQDQKGEKYIFRVSVKKI